MSTGRDQTIGYLSAAGTVAIWTGFILISRLGGKSALTGHDILALRLGVAAFLLLPFAGSLPRGAWRDVRLWALGMIGGLLYGVLVYAGFKLVPAAHGGILLPGMQPFLVAGVAWLLTRQRMPRERAFGLAFIALGVGFAAQSYLGGSTWSPAMLAGDALILSSALMWAFYSVLAKRWGFHPWLLTRFVAFSSALVYLPVYLLWLPKQLDAVPMSTLVLQGLYQGLGATIIAMLLFLKAVEKLGAERVGALIALVPVLAGVAAVPLLDEALTGWLLAGLVCVSLGAFVAARPLARLVPAAVAAPR
ncbi:DMT family transporter [Azoarcus sp. DN11]|uniref:DMT family transporter n=1 Tax=Azoarcus sp. DN11 TaxID=356837 RepID=UPI000EB3D042|nr:DMT family transporter [Azoarcus sp. DN11]AYH42118.1 EamA family transporter [Azoarcus sp. DN11]